MAVLRDQNTGRTCLLCAGGYAGSVPPADLVVGHPQVSKRHAEIMWVDNDWVLSDLRSSNGTFVNGKRVTRDVRLEQGDIIVFGHRDAGEWEVVDTEPPTLMVVSATTGERRAAKEGRLELPQGDDEPIVLVWQEQVWRIASSRQAVFHGMILQGQGGPWCVHVSTQPTLMMDQWTLDTIRLVFHVEDADHIRLTMITDAGEQDLGERQWRPLLILAEAKLADAEAGIEGDEQGRVEVNELEAEIGEGLLETQMCRIRDAFEKARVVDGRQIIQSTRARQEKDHRGRKLTIPGYRRIAISADRLRIVR